MLLRRAWLSLLAVAFAAAPAWASPNGGDTGSLRAAIEDLIGRFGNRYAKGGHFLGRLSKIEPRLRSAKGAEATRLKKELETLRREALLANPLVADRPILFVVRHQYASDHHNTATLFQTGEINTNKFKGPAAIKVLDLARGGKVRTLLEVPRGVARDPEVSADGRRVVFSMRKDKEDDYHIYEMKADGTGLRQLTSGKGISDIDPVYLGDGRIVFTSSREPKFCMCNRHIMGNLFRMDADGTNLDQIGKSTLFEGHPAVLPDGRILYDRWEYVDRNFGDAQGLWTCNPDGTRHVVYWGNHTPSPGAVLDARPIPGTHRVVVVFSSCHDRPWGALAILDAALGLDGKEPVIQTWPASAMNLVMQGNYDKFKKVSPKYEDPYPLSDRHFLCVRQTGKGDQTAIYLVDTFGNEVLVHAEAPGCFDPMPLAPPVEPPAAVPDAILPGRPNGYFYVHDVYIGAGMEEVKRGTVKSLRVVESPEKRFWSPKAWSIAGQQAPGMNWHDFNNKRILGTVPVEPDGSAFFAVPADRFVYFQLLDDEGMMVQSMRSGTIVRPGETQGCVGCHEERRTAVANTPSLASRKAPRKLEPWYGPERLFNYAAEVQPVFDRHCVSCHDTGKPDGVKLNLAGDVGLIFNISYTQLWSRKQIKAIGAGPAEVLPPRSWGSHASTLVKVIREGHENIKLDRESFDRIVTWIDINAPYYPSYASAYPSNLYGRSPLDDKQLKRLSQITKINLHKQPNAAMISFTRPELSACLNGLAKKNPDGHAEALRIIREGARTLASRPRPDMKGFKLSGNDLERNEKYEALDKTMD